MVNLLAAVVQVTGLVTGLDGEKVVVDPMRPIWHEALILILVLLPVILILLFFFYKKKLQHQQIIAAMEKGLPVKDLLEVPNKKETGWIPNISAGIGLLFVAIALAIIYYPLGVYSGTQKIVLPVIAIPIVFAGLGITRLLRGLFQKVELKKKPVYESDEEEVDTSPPALPAE